MPPLKATPQQRPATTEKSGGQSIKEIKEVKEGKPFRAKLEKMTEDDLPLVTKLNNKHTAAVGKTTYKKF